MRRTLAGSAFITLVASAALSAQAPVTPGWSAFAGCWAPVPVNERAPSSDDPRVCIVPVGTNGADLVSVVSGKEADRSHIEADGQHHNASRQGCTGWESATFSSDGRRLYLRSEHQCQAGMTRTQSGILGLASNGEWTSAVNVTSDSGSSVRVSRYTPISLTPQVPAEIRAVLEPREMSDRTARVSASLPRLSTNAIIEAAKNLTSPVLEAWLPEAGYEFELNDKTLVQLADGGVTPAVIDVMVAVANPNVFAVRPAGMSGAGYAGDSAFARRMFGHYGDCSTPTLDPWGYAGYDPCDPYNRYSAYGSRYGYNRYGYDGYGYNGYNGYSSPVVIVVRSSDPELKANHGRMTDNGYKRNTGSSTSDGTASRETAPRATTSSSGSGSSSSTGTSSSSGSSSSGGDSGRTATRKPPTA